MSVTTTFGKIRIVDSASPGKKEPVLTVLAVDLVGNLIVEQRLIRHQSRGKGGAGDLRRREWRRERRLSKRP